MTGTRPAGEEPGGAVRRLIGDRDFARFQALIQREAGIWLSPIKKALLVGRLAKRLRELGITSYADYYERVVEDPVERTTMLDCISTNETHFFREPRHFEFLREQVFPRWTTEAAEGRRPRRVRAWSAACSTGEEPYSLAMCLLGAFPPGSGWDLEVFATDISTRVLDWARDAIWPVAKAQEIPGADRKAFMLRGVGGQEGKMRAGPEIRALVRFQRFNLNDETYPTLGTFHLVFCRNVLIYFAAPTKVRVVEKVLGHLAPDGYLFLGHAESLSGMAQRVQAVIPTVYVHASSAAAGRRASAG